MTIPDPESFFRPAVSKGYGEVYKYDIPRPVEVTD